MRLIHQVRCTADPVGCTHGRCNFLKGQVLHCLMQHASGPQARHGRDVPWVGCLRDSNLCSMPPSNIAQNTNLIAHGETPSSGGRRDIDMLGHSWAGYNVSLYSLEIPTATSTPMRVETVTEIWCERICCMSHASSLFCFIELFQDVLEPKLRPHSVTISHSPHLVKAQLPLFRHRETTHAPQRAL